MGLDTAQAPTDGDHAGGAPRRTYVAVFLVCLAMLTAEVTVTRLLSYKFFFHFVFLALSLAQLGIAGAAATVFAGGQRSFAPEYFRSRLLGLAAAPVLFLGVYAWLSPEPPAGWTKLNGTAALPYLVALSLMLVLLYFFAGSVLSALFTQYQASFNGLYAADLLGASAGCLAALGLMWAVGPVRAFVVCGLLALAAAAAFGAGGNPGERRSRWAMIVFVAVLNVGAWFSAPTFESGGRQRYEYEWNQIARTERRAPSFYVIDGDAGTALDNPDWTSEVEFLVAPHHPRVAVVGVGAGPQLRMALRFDPASVFAVDINPTILGWDLDKDAEHNGHIFSDPRVTVELGEGRHAMRNRPGPFDLIVMHAIDTYTASSMGAYSLTENYLYTVEAFKNFYDKLAPDGLMAVRRWLFHPPRETLRLFTTVWQALSEEGVADPGKHLVVLSPVRDNKQPGLKVMGMLLFSKTPFSAERLATLNQYVDAHGWSFVYRPDKRLDSAFAEYATTPDRAAFFRDYPYFVEPCRDENPFFFQLSRPLDFLGGRSLSNPDFYIYNQSTLVLVVTLGMLVVLSYLLLALPVLRHRRRAGLPRPPWRITVYFACLGLGFMAMEIASVQTMTLFLGHPTYALSVILLGTLAFAGLGSLLARRIPPNRTLGVCSLVGIGALAAAVGLLPLVHAMMGAPFWARVLVTLGYLALVGIPMGMPMALGIRQIPSEDRPQVAWAWACNGAAGVVGTNVCTLVMIYYGMPAVFLAAGACYLLAQVLLGRGPAPAAAVNY